MARVVFAGLELDGNGLELDLELGGNGWSPYNCTAILAHPLHMHIHIQSLLLFVMGHGHTHSSQAFILAN